MNEDKRKKAIIKLCLWCIFIAIVILIISLSNKNNNSNMSNYNEEVKETSVYEKIINNIGNNYNYNYEIKIGENVFKFVGTKLGNKEIGYRIQNDNEYINYLIEDDKIYLINNNEILPYTDLYLNIDNSYLEIEKIKNILLNNKYEIKENNYVYNIDDKNIVVYIDEKTITKIEISLGNDYYILEYSDFI